jgi:hypothetical protein
MEQQSLLSKVAPPDSASAWNQEANIKEYLVVYSNNGVHMGLHSAEVFLTPTLPTLQGNYTCDYHRFFISHSI